MNDVYAKLNAADVDGLWKYVLSGGYTEFVEDGSGLITIDQGLLREEFASGVKFDLSVRDLKVSVFGDSAVVTGYRVGSVSDPGKEPDESTLCLSMTWVKKTDGWKLTHVHLSPFSPVPSNSATVREVHDAWFHGLLEEDTAILDRILSPDVTLAFPGGGVTPREAFLGDLKSGDLFYDSADHHELNVRMYGDAAVLTGQSTLAVRFPGTSFSEHLTYTATYVRSEVGWQMVAWQSTVPFPESEPEDPREARNRETSRLWIDEVWGKGRLELVQELVASEYVRHQMGTTTVITPEEYASYIEKRLSANVEFAVHSTAFEGDLAWSRFSTRVVAPDGTERLSKGLQVYRLEDGKLAETWWLNEEGAWSDLE